MRLIGKLLLALSVLVFCCTDAGLYGKGMADPSADRLGVTGRVCTDDPHTAGFPVKIVFVIDQADGPLFASFDPELLRLKALQDVLSLHGGNANFSFAIAGMGPSPVLHAPTEGSFTRNAGELTNAVSLLSLQRGCAGTLCRNYEDSVHLVRSLVEGDLAAMTAGQRTRSQYVAVFVSAGAPEPMGGSWTGVTRALTEQIGALKADVEAEAASFRMHVLHLAAEEEPDETQALLEAMAFAGEGTFERFNVPDTITFEKLGLLKLSALLEAKSLLAVNVNALPGLDGTRIDSDADGLSDVAEERLGTDPLSADSDGDGIGDMVENLVVTDPVIADEQPAVCVSLVEQIFGDMDDDRLNNCEELLLGTDLSLPDTDGDGITDWVEVVFGTDYLMYDYLDDADWDGVENGEEARAHTDPRTNDSTSHLASGYRYEEVDEGFVREPSVEMPKEILGVDILDAGTDSSGGVGQLRFDAAKMTLAWRDAKDVEAGPAVDVAEGGEFVLYGRSASDGADAETTEQWVRVNVIPSLLPPSDNNERLLVEISEKHCIRFTVRNIKLVDTREGDDGSGPGMNDVFLYFAQAPEGDLLLPGLFRVAHIPVVFDAKKGRRTPSSPLVELRDGDFMTVGF